MASGRVTGWFLVPLFCVLSIALATLVDDTDDRISYTGSGWSTDNNPNNNGGSARRTNVTGDHASFNFTGNAIVLYGASQINGAPFTFNVDGTPKMCTCYQNGTKGVQYQTQLCSVFQLVPTFHTLVITHTGTDGFWLNIDDLQVALNEATIALSSTTTSTSTFTPTSTAIISASVTSSAAHNRPSKVSRTGILVGVITGGIVALLAVSGGIAILCFKFRHRRQKREQHSEPQASPVYRPLLPSENENSRLSMEYQNVLGGVNSRPAVRNVLWDTQGRRNDPASSQRYNIYSPTSEDTDASGSQIPLTSLTSRIERSSRNTQQTPTSSRGSHLAIASDSSEGGTGTSLYPPGPASILSTRHTPSSSAHVQYSRLPIAEEPQSTPMAAPRPRRFRALPDIWGERRRRDSQADAYSDVLHTRSELASPPPLSTVSPPPPSYRTATPTTFRILPGQGGRG